MGDGTDHRAPCRKPASGDPAPESGKLALRLYTPDADLRRAWTAARVPAGFRLRVLDRLGPQVLSAAGPSLVLIDASAAASASEEMASAIEAHLHRCVWTGPAQALDRLGEARLQGAYDILLTPVTPATLTRRLAGWARDIERTAALDRLGRRVDDLAEQSGTLSARLSDAEHQVDALAEGRRRLDQALRRVREVARLSRRINSLDLDEIVDVCVHHLPGLVEARRSSLYLYDAESDRLVLQGRSHDEPVAERVDLAANPNSPMTYAVRRGELLLIGELTRFQRDQDITLARPFEGHYETASCMIIPLKGGGRVLGVLNLADKTDGSPFDAETDLPVIEQIGELIGASLYNVELFREMEHRAKSDPLTGLANRRVLEEALGRETDRARRYGARLSVLMVDVDGLKAINDRFGHPAGDAVLQTSAAILLETVRSVDVPGRWAGDEFLVILPDTTGHQAKQLARRLRRRVRQQPAHVNQEDIRASLSIGVAEYATDETPEALIRRVDTALYQAKGAGRNRIASAKPTP